MANHILFVLEGEKTERQIIENLKKNILKDISHTTIISVYCGNIYNLYSALNQDDDLDLFPLLKGNVKNEGALQGLVRGDISEIFLFFDYDGHDPTATDRKLEKMIYKFSNETEEGKLYMSYPMVESLKHIQSDVHFSKLTVNAKDKIGYKEIVSKSVEKDYCDLRKLTSVHWSRLLSWHCKKANYLMTDSFELPVEIIEQKYIFKKQLEKHITPESQVAVLSAFPIFIADYYGYTALPKMIEGLSK